VSSRRSGSRHVGAVARFAPQLRVAATCEGLISFGGTWINELSPPRTLCCATGGIEAVILPHRDKAQGSAAGSRTAPCSAQLARHDSGRGNSRWVTNGVGIERLGCPVYHGGAGSESGGFHGAWEPNGGTKSGVEPVLDSTATWNRNESANSLRRHAHREGTAALCT
jgi:hypothetical protein